MTPTSRIFFQIHDSQRLLVTWGLNNFLSGNLVSFCIAFLVFELLLHPDWRYHHSFCLCMEFICKLLNIKHHHLRDRVSVSPKCTNYIGDRGYAPQKKKMKIGLSETPYHTFPGSNAINSYVYFVELFSEYRYSWLPNRITNTLRFMIPKLSVNMILTCFDWFMVHDSAPTLDLSISIHVKKY